MRNYQKMIEANRLTSLKKVAKALEEINYMLAEEKKISVGELVKRTGLSRAFYYKNKSVREELEKAIDLQKGKVFVKSQKIVLNVAMEHELKVLQRQNAKLKDEKEVLKAKCDKLENALRKQNLKFIKSL